MAGSDSSNQVAKRVIDELKEVSGESKPCKYMKVFIQQQVADFRNFVEDVGPQVEIARNKLRQLNAIIAEFHASNEIGDDSDTLESIRHDQADGALLLVDLEYWVNKAHAKIELKLKHLGFEDNDG